MTHHLRIPEAAQSPYPLHPAPMPAHADEAETGAEEQANAGVGNDARDESNGVSGWASPGRIGAAIGIGSAAIVAAMLYTRYNRRETNDRGAGAARRGQGSDKGA